MKKMFLSVLTLLLSFTTTVVLAGGPSANIQVIHNSPLLAGLGSIDLYYYFPGGSSGLLGNDLDYREASAFVNVTSSLANLNGFSLGIAPSSSTGIGDTLVDVGLFGNLTDNTTYVMMVYGQGNILLVNPALTSSPGGAGTAALSFFHGGDDAPAVDVLARGVTTLYDNVEFGDFLGYVTVPAATYVIDVFDSTSTTKVKSYYAPLSTASGAAGVAFASGYLNPGAGEPAFGVFAALPSGTVIALPEIKQSLVQVIHNSADAAAATVDAYVVNDLAGTDFQVTKVDNFAYRNATAFVPVEYVNGPVTIGLAGSASASVADTIGAATQAFPLTPGTNYTVVAAGHLSTSGYTPNQPFAYYVASDLKATSAGGAGFIAVKVFHGATDAPEVDGRISAPSAAAGTVGDNLSYGEFGSYTDAAFVQGSLYNVQLTAPSGSPVIAESTPLPLGLNPQANGLAFNLYVTGYVDPTVNSNGQSLQVCAASPNGNPVTGVGLLCFDLVLATAVEEKIVNKMIMYPNPTQGNFNIEYTLESAQDVTYNVYNNLGQVVLNGTEGTQQAGRNAVKFDLSNFSTGQYSVQMLIGNEVNITRSFIKE